MNFKSIKRKKVNVSQQSLVKTELIASGQQLPLVIKPSVEGVNLIHWTSHHRDWLETKLLQHGGILFRNFAINNPEDLEQLTQAISSDLLSYSYRSTPRTQVKGKIYTSTEYPADRSIPLHNEMSYTRSWPMKIWFACLQPAAEGGETPIADSRKVFQRLDPSLRERFAQQGIMYLRNYSKGLDIPWQEVFQTDDPAAVEAYCREAGIEWEWIGDEQLRTRQICQATARHPKTGEAVWFNQAHLFHVSSLSPEVRQYLLTNLGEENLPRNTYYGNASPIAETDLDQIRDVYEQETIVFSWQAGDILMLDNMLAAHGRKPFSGSRRVVVSMAESCQQGEAR
ncbi:MAG: TauD/TfdA family dioxygenase [Cyanobacteria bacterium]|jgi:alpha-ketoglutarate-dependent taurine dioxygenase|nr:TauD/TfdA family dioxygenase [Cyanobacteria bacterium GSL.Bin1]